MKKILIISNLVLLHTFLSAQTTSTQTEDIATFCKIWGFLKYYHPSVAKGNMDWDSVFMHRIADLPNFKSKQELSNYYKNWIESLGEIQPCKKCGMKSPDSHKLNFDLSWTDDKNKFSDSLIALLDFVEKNRNIGSNYYVQLIERKENTSYENEKVYKDSIFPTSPLRLLSLSRYWNIINYFFPYKYLTDQKWNTVLTEMIPRFKNAEDTTAYHLAMLELTTKINDSHGAFSTAYTSKYFGHKAVPFNIKIIDNKAVVIGLRNVLLCNKDDIQKGDAIISVEEKPIYALIEEKKRYVAASNESVIRRQVRYLILNGATDSVKIRYERNGEITDKYIHRYGYKELNLNADSTKKMSKFEVLKNNIGYVNIGHLKEEDVKETIESLKKTKAIILDTRAYPNDKSVYSILDFLTKEDKEFVKFTKPNLSYPSQFRYSKPQKGVRKNPDFYKGKVVVLMDESTQSQAEFVVMIAQTAPNVKCIGSQTAGADGNVSIIVFPGNLKTKMTGIGVYYPDGRETQRIGIVPDIEVKPTIKGIKEGRDEVLEKAIEWICSEKD